MAENKFLLQNTLTVQEYEAIFSKLQEILPKYELDLVISHERDSGLCRIQGAVLPSNFAKNEEFVPELDDFCTRSELPKFDYKEISLETQPRLYHAIKSGPERIAEVEQFKLMYDKNNVGLVLDRVLEHSIAEQEAKLLVDEKSAIIEEQSAILADQQEQIRLAVEENDISGLTLIWSGLKTIVTGK